MSKSWKNFAAWSDTQDKPAGIVVCLNENEQILIIRRSSTDPHGRAGQWTVPGGHIDDDDTSIEAGAARELKEETNLVCETGAFQYLGELKDGKYYFLATKWSGEVDVSIPNPKTGFIEHDDYKWASISDIKDIDNTEIPIYLLEKALEMSKNVK
tara:strand:+ start:2246 stop:2710 length:465 start_codon:yes stop_codon:yes gene_type:complete